MANELIFNETTIPFHPHDTVAQALWRANVMVWSFSYSRNRPQGLFCGIGRCGSCLAQVEGSPRLLCMELARPMLNVKPFPVGQRPGLSSTDFPTAPPFVLCTDVLIVGGGWYGIMVASLLQAQKIDTIQVDERPWRQHTHSLWSTVVALWPGLDNVSAWSIAYRTAYLLSARYVVLATGTVSVPDPAIGVQIPGVLTEDALTMLYETKTDMPPGGVLLVRNRLQTAPWSYWMEQFHPERLVWHGDTDVVFEGSPHLDAIHVGHTTVHCTWIGVPGALRPSRELLEGFLEPNARVVNHDTWIRYENIFIVGRAASPNSPDDRLIHGIHDVVATISSQIKEVKKQ